VSAANGGDRMDSARAGSAGASTDPNLLSVRDLVVEYPGKDKSVRVLHGVTFDVPAGSTFAVVGESGCGKTTLARSLVRLLTPTSGHIQFEGVDLATLSERQMRRHRRHIQMIFQDPYGSLDPHMKATDLIGEALRMYHDTPRGKVREKVAELMGMVGLNPESGGKRPEEFSGGQRQRIGIARALAVQPRLLVCDEPTSALDVSVQAQVLGLLAELRERLGVTYVFISHNLGVVRQISDVVAVMYLGRIVEMGPAEELFAVPRHPYTKALIYVVPDPGRAGPTKPRRAVLTGDLPSPTDPPSGCPFRTRCPLAIEKCAESMPPLVEVRPGHFAACWRTDEVPAWQPHPMRDLAEASAGVDDPAHVERPA
jgi:oligopeptide transport system ATP-binding protein